jgi:cysteine-rich repeat protein
MKLKLLVAALVMVGACDNHLGIGDLGPDTGVAMLDAGGFPADLGVGGAVGSGGVVSSLGGKGGCGILCIGNSGGTGGDTTVSSSLRICGNGTLDPGEQCDDGNRSNGDGCNALCQVEANWLCPSPGQACIDATVCGDGILTSNETCDDGNTLGDDGCSADCQGIEPGWICPTPGQPCTPILAGRDAGSAGTLDAPVAQSPDAPVAGGSSWWTGYIENYQFNSGSDAVKFTFSVDSTGQVIGKVVLGNGTPPPSATDPNVGYPSDAMVTSGSISGYWAEGFAYSMGNGISSSQRIQFTIQNYELWSGWCALQTPVPDSDMCLPNWGGVTVGPKSDAAGCYQQNPASGQLVPVDCGKFHLCVADAVCMCSTTACAENTGAEAAFDLTITGNTANGSVTGIVDRANVHFTLEH